MKKARDRDGTTIRSHRQQLATKLLEGVIKSGWEVVSSAEFTTTPGTEQSCRVCRFDFECLNFPLPGFELVTWVFKRSATPIGGDGNGQVVALMLTPPNRSVAVAASGRGALPLDPEMQLPDLYTVSRPLDEDVLWFMF